MLGPDSNVADVSMLYSPTPMKRRSDKKVKSPSKRRSSKSKKVVESGLVTPTQDLESISSPTVGTATTAGIDSDSESDATSFFSEAFSAISELPDTLEGESPLVSDIEESPKKSKKKKKKEKSLKSPKTPKTPKTPKSPKKKKKKDKTPKSEKSSKKKSAKPDSPKKKKKSKSEKSPRKSPKKSPKKKSKKSAEDSDDESFLGEAFDGTQRVEPKLQQSETHTEDFPGGPPLWEAEEEEDRGETWEEDKSWLDWGDADDRSEFMEETVGDASSCAFSYYTVHSNEELDATMELLDDADIEDDEVTEITGITETTGRRSESAGKKVCFNDEETVHETLHICDFTPKEIRKTWYQQQDYENTIEGVKEVACNAETPRDTQMKFRKHRSAMSKKAEVRGLEAWTPSGVQRFRYVKEAAFRAVWDEQQKQIENCDEDELTEFSTISENQERLREAYERVSQRSLMEAQLRAERDEELAIKAQPRRNLKKRGAWQEAMGNSSRGLLDGSNHGLSDSPGGKPASCLKLNCSDEFSPNSSFGGGRTPLTRSSSGRSLTDLVSGLLSPGTPAKRAPARRGSLERSLSMLDSSSRSAKSMFTKSDDRSVFSARSERSAKSMFSLGKNKPERRMFRQMSDRGMLNKENDRGLGLFKKEGRSLFSKGSDGKRTGISDFEPIVEVSKKNRKKSKKRSSKSKEGRGLSRSQSVKDF